MGKKQAFISPILPDDFLRVLLDQRQIAENKDSQLARQLQYGVAGMPMAINQYGVYGGNYREFMDYGRGRLQIDVVEAKLNKNYGWITRMDPYVRIKVGSRMFETPTCYNGNKNPEWRKTIIWYDFTCSYSLLAYFHFSNIIKFTNIILYAAFLPTQYKF